MKNSVCEQFGAVVGLTSSELASLTAYVNANGLSDKLSEHIAYARKRPGTISMIKQQWLAKLPKQSVASQLDSAPPVPGAVAPPPIAQQETYSHAAIGGVATPGSWTMATTLLAGLHSETSALPTCQQRNLTNGILLVMRRLTSRKRKMQYML